MSAPTLEERAADATRKVSGLMFATPGLEFDWPGDQVRKVIADAIAAALEERTRECAKAVCKDCAAGSPVRPFPSSEPEWSWVHIDERGVCVHRPCSAIYAAFPAPSGSRA